MPFSLSKISQSLFSPFVTPLCCLEDQTDVRVTMWKVSHQLSKYQLTRPIRRTLTMHQSEFTKPPYQVYWDHNFKRNHLRYIIPTLRHQTLDWSNNLELAIFKPSNQLRLSFQLADQQQHYLEHRPKPKHETEYEQTETEATGQQMSIFSKQHKLESKTTCPWPCLAIWYTIAADVTVLPVPGGPWMRLIGFCRTLLTAKTYNSCQVKNHKKMRKSINESTAQNSIISSETSTKFDYTITSSTVTIFYMPTFTYIRITLLISDS